MTQDKPVNRATDYLMTLLLQRLESSKPGLIQELLDGVLADTKAVATAGDMTPDVEETFTVARSILERARG
ncbi:hypothetical protein [Hoeflea poritis]|uniref:Uncharacterized protein n=1 Tax=Hoeflea poritis TaxID=2993659 RepID=A0ABT4VR18_9HYPH|nr:hypothetical protein [Hoeflea poritis]MDA4846532.1 hypothetical protein [Hoeflea poritis]